MILARLSIPDVVVVTPTVHGDARGYFMETWHERKFADAGLALSFVQDNQSRSHWGTLRGLHYQLERPQGKLVRVVAGEIFDVAVDVRASSSTFGRWVGRLLSAENKEQLYVPPGFAHGFLVTSRSADVVYKCTDFYFPEHELTLAWDDDAINIAWPLAAGQAPTLSAKDRSGSALRELETFA